MKGFLLATLAIFHGFQLVRMGFLVARCNVVVFLAFRAGKDDLITFAIGHKNSLFFLLQVQV